MKPGIALKLFIALVSVGTVAAFAMSIASRVSFTRGFLGYLNEQGVERIEALAPDLVAAYRLHGSWDFLRNDPAAWFEVLRPRPPGMQIAPGRFPPGSPPSAALLGLDLRIGLRDTDDSFVAGNRELGNEAARRAVRVDDVIVGWLTLAPFEQISGAADVRFRNRQSIMTWIIAAFAIALAGTVSFWLSRRLLAGLQQVATSVHHLADGDYTVNVPVLSNDEIGSLASDCNRLARTLERAAAARREFMADVSHELRTPVAVLRAELELLEDGIRAPTVESLHSLSSEVGRISSLIEDIYELSLSDAGALAYRMHSFDICAVLNSEIRSFSERLAQRHIRIITKGINEPLQVTGDEDRLRQLFGNILENSARYIIDDGLLQISCRKLGQRVELEFDDSGPGVPDDLVGKLFDRFFRVDDSRNRESGGAGLGLAICKNIVEAHGGSIKADRSNLGGLSIRITLPQSTPTVQAS